MSHIRQKMTRKSNSYRVLIIGSLFICLFTLFEVLTATAHAATLNTGATGATHRSNPTKILKSNLAELSGTKNLALDWRTQSYNINFSLPTHDWYEALDLFISATPQGKVSKRTPLLLSFNGSEPVALNGRGSRFDAHIRLDTSRIRTTNNSLTITYQTPSDANCLTKSHGKWTFDLSRSKLVATTRAKTRNLHISEIEPRLTHAMTTPKRVAIIAKGTNKLALEAIIAQGVAQRTHALPSFQFTTNRADFAVLIGTNKQLRSLVRNKKMLNKTSPSVFVDAGLHPRLILSAPNDGQLIEVARAFASFHLPAQHRANISLFDLYSADRLTPRPTLGEHQYRLGDIGDVSISPSWQASPAELMFNVEDARASSGVLTLNLSASRSIRPESRLKLSLNGKSLGFTKLDKNNKVVAFDIPQGSLKSSSNQLAFSPEFTTDATGATEHTCALAANIPALLVSTKSKLQLTNTAPTPTADLSRLAGSGSLFNVADDAALVLTAKTANDRAATLHFLGFAARQFGPMWVGADYYTALPSGTGLEKNILIIGPRTPIDTKLIASAPRAVKLALGGNVLRSPKTEVAAMPKHDASNEVLQAFALTARNVAMPARIQAGGIASIFPSPYANGKLIGIISATQPANYSQAMKSLSTDKYWNALQGSVTRWDRKTILMAQMSKPAPQGFFPEKPKASPLTKLHIKSFADVKTDIGQWISGLKPSKPKFAENVSVQPKSGIPLLRGTTSAIPIPTLKPHLTISSPQKPNQTPLFASSVTFPNMQTGLAASFDKLKAGVDTLRNTGFSAQSMDGLLANIKRNRLAWMLIFAGIGFFLLAFASPKEA